MALPAISAPCNFRMAAAIPLSTFTVGIAKTDSTCDCWEIVGGESKCSHHGNYTGLYIQAAELWNHP